MCLLGELVKSEVVMTNSESVIDKFEAAFHDCLAPLVANEPSLGITFQDEPRLSVEHAVTKFLDLARETEGMFVKHKVAASMKVSENILRHEIDELAREIQHKDEILKNNFLQLKQVQAHLRELSLPKEKVIKSPAVAAAGNSHPISQPRK